MDYKYLDTKLDFKNFIGGNEDQTAQLFLDVKESHMYSGLCFSVKRNSLFALVLHFYAMRLARIFPRFASAA